MKTPEHRDVIAVLSEILDLMPEMRVGQLIALLGDFGHIEFGYRLGDLEDEQLLILLERQLEHLRNRSSSRTIPAENLVGVIPS